MNVGISSIPFSRGTSEGECRPLSTKITLLELKLVKCYYVIPA